jgi:hypothetical protein
VEVMHGGIKMIDESLIRRILFEDDPEETRKIHPGDMLSYGLVEMMSKSTRERIRRCFAKVDSYKNIKYYVEIECKRCHCHFIRGMGQSKTISYILHMEESICDKCFAIIQDEQKREQEQKIIEREEKKAKDFLYFICTYFEPGYDFAKPNAYENFNFLRNAINSFDSVERDKICKHIRAMNYNDFLDTPYWKAIARYVKYRSGYKCRLCGSKENLNVHHRSYEFHGQELQKWDTELICICKRCHEKHHDIV